MNGNNHGRNPDILRTNIGINSDRNDYHAAAPSNFALGMSTPNETQVLSQQSERFFSATQREEIAEKLAKRLAPECISQRPAPGGSKVSYIEGNQAISLANSIFGHDGWSTQLMSSTTEFLEPTPAGKFNCAITTVVRVTVFTTGAFHEDFGFGEMVNCPTRGAAIEKSRKESVTDAVKRCLRYFGNSTGNCLYDKDYSKEIIKHKDKNRYRYDPDQLYRPPEFDYRPNHVREQEERRLTQQRQQQQAQEKEREKEREYHEANVRRMSGVSNSNSNGSLNTSAHSSIHPTKDDDLIWDGFEMNDASMVSVVDDKSVIDDNTNTNASANVNVGSLNDINDGHNNKRSLLMPPPPIPNGYQQQPSPPHQQQDLPQPQPHAQAQQTPFSSPKKNKGAESRAAALKRGRENTMVSEKSEQPPDATTLKKSKS